MPEAATRLLTALAEALEIAKRERLEIPRDAIGEVGRWAMRQRCVATCARCSAPMLGPARRRPQLCPSCSAPLPPRAAG